MKRSIQLVLGLAALLGTTQARAQQDSLQTGQNLLDMSLEDLMDVKVSTASKSNETKQNAPAMVSVVSAKEIQAYGANSLSEVLDRVASIYINGSYLFPTSLSMRGDNTGLYDTHVLYLLNGRPMRESLNNGINLSILQSLPLSAIERVEIIKGPGSVLYSTSAGIINLITKEAEQNSIGGSVRYGSFGTIQTGVNGTARVKGVAVSGAVHYLEDQGWNFTARDERSLIRNKANTADSLAAPQTIRTAKQGVGALLQFGYRGFKAVANHNAFQQNVIGRSPIWRNPLDFALASNRSFVDVGYSHAFSKRYSSSLNVTYNHQRYRVFVPLDNYQDNEFLRASNDVLAEWTHYLHPTQRLNLVAGALTNTQTGWGTQAELKSDQSSYDVRLGVNPDPFQALPHYNQTWLGAYLQADYAATRWMKLVAGGQVNKATNIAATFVPRLGSIVTINSRWGAKLLYGQASRSASFFEKNIQSVPAIVGNPKLRAEVLGTLEGQVNYTTAKVELSATYFRSHQDDLITRSNIKDSLYLLTYRGKLTSVPGYINRGNLDLQGVEIEGKSRLHRHLSTVGSISYQTNEDHQGQQDISGMPKLMAKLGVNYDHQRGVSLGVFNAYSGKGGDIAVYDEKGTIVTKPVNPPVAAYHNLTANLNVDLFKLLGTGKKSVLMLNLYGVNLLNAQIYYPEISRKNINSIPGRAGRSLYASVSVSL